MVIERERIDRVVKAARYIAARQAQTEQRRPIQEVAADATMRLQEIRALLERATMPTPTVAPVANETSPAQEADPLLIAEYAAQHGHEVFSVKNDIRSGELLPVTEGGQEIRYIGMSPVPGTKRKLSDRILHPRRKPDVTEIYETLNGERLWLERDAERIYVIPNPLHRRTDATPRSVTTDQPQLVSSGEQPTRRRLGTDIVTLTSRNGRQEAASSEPVLNGTRVPRRMGGQSLPRTTINSNNGHSNGVGYDQTSFLPKLSVEAGVLMQNGASQRAENGHIPLRRTPRRLGQQAPLEVTTR